MDSEVKRVLSRSRRATSVLPLTLASLAAAVLTWGLQAAAGRALGPEGYAAFMVVWGLIFFEVGVLSGVQQEVTRAVTDAHSAPHTAARSSVLRLSLAFGVAGGLGVVISSPLWASRLFGSHGSSVSAAAAVALFLYAVYNGVNGALAGLDRWMDYAAAMACEAVLRLSLVSIALVLSGGLSAQAWALAGAGATWVVLSARRGFRAALVTRGTGTFWQFSTRSLHALVATGCSAIMIAGFPVLLKITADRPLPAEAGVVLAAIVATRAPLLLPLAAFQTVVLSRFVHDPARRLVFLARLSGATALVTAVGAFAAYVVGPTLLVLLYGPLFTIDPTLIALLVVAAGLLTVQTLTGAAVLASNHHRVYAISWLAATGSSVLILMTDVPVADRSAAALIVGALLGLVINVATLLIPGMTATAARRARDSRPSPGPRR